MLNRPVSLLIVFATLAFAAALGIHLAAQTTPAASQPGQAAIGRGLAGHATWADPVNGQTAPDCHSPAGGEYVRRESAVRRFSGLPALPCGDIRAVVSHPHGQRDYRSNGQSERRAGRFHRDANNHYVVRANALEGNVVLYKVENGKRTDLPLKGSGRTYGKKAQVPKNTWSLLGLTVRGPLFTVSLNGQGLFEVEDTTFTAAGKVGLWTKADSVTYFDDLTIVPR